MDNPLQALEASLRLSNFIQSNLSEHADAVGVNQIVAIALYSISLEHREATMLLVNAGAYTSMRGLARSALEAYVTGCWYDTVATEEQVRLFMRGNRPPPTFEKMAQRLRDKHALGELFEKLRKHYKTLSDYAHGHSRQASRWIHQGSVEPRHDSREVTELLRFCDIVGVLACLGRESAANRPLEPFTAMYPKVIQGDY